MSIGTFIISIFVSLAFVYGYLVWAESTATNIGIFNKIIQFSKRFFVLRRPVAMLGAIFAVCTTTYTGFLLSAITTNALWSIPFFGLVSIPFLAVLFLVSGLSTGLAATLLGATKSDDVKIYKKIDIGLIVIELLLLALLYLTVNPLYFSGSMATLFWIGVVVIGLIVPLLLSVYALYRHTRWIAPVYGMVIIGGLCLRYFIVYSGQMF
jgi:polysulfide reductase chain C